MSENGPPPDRPELLGNAESKVRDRIHKEMPHFGPIAMLSLEAGQPFIRGFLNKGDQHRAASTVFNQAASDYIGILNELADGNGRSAVRSARSLIEHAVNFADVTSSQKRADRYLAHLAFEAEFSANFELGLELLKPRERRKVQAQKAHKLRKVAIQLKSSLIQYGRGFRLSWSEVNLKDRADRHGLQDLYPAYKLSSLFIHGASGGELGLTKQIGPKRVIRTGPAIDLCPFAYITAIRAMEQLVQRASRLRKDLDAQPFLDALENLASVWPDYSEAAREVDRKVWPTTPPLPPMAVLAVAANGFHRWYWHDPEARALIEATPPALEEKFQRAVDEVIAEVKKHPERFLENDRRFATACFFDFFTVTPKHDGRMIPDEAILLRPDEFSALKRLQPPDSR